MRQTALSMRRAIIRGMVRDLMKGRRIGMPGAAYYGASVPGSVRRRQAREALA